MTGLARVRVRVTLGRGRRAHSGPSATGAGAASTIFTVSIVGLPSISLLRRCTAASRTTAIQLAHMPLWKGLGRSFHLSG